jgi:hydroxymethylbilane synthase
MAQPNNDFKIVCRGSMLSRAQADHFIQKARAYDSQSNFSVVIKDTAGDRDQQTLLQDMDGKDFFTKEIQDFLVRGNADFAVHSLKDVSSELFFKDSQYAVISREDPRDVAIFNANVLARIAAKETIRIGTSSPRRALMAVRFLQQALPTVDGCAALVEPHAIRGNVDTRLQKLHDGQYDCIILAVAGLNRLLRYGPSTTVISQLLAGKRTMVLPLIECPPAPGQGAIVVEARPGNQKAVDLLGRMNESLLQEATQKERMMATRYGAGCHQQFGVVYLSTPQLSFTYGAGVSSSGSAFSVYENYPRVETAGKQIFSAGDHMKSFFRYSYPAKPSALPPTKAIFAGSQHALRRGTLIHDASQHVIWAAGTKTWFQLARKGLWVNGCTDALGLEFMERWFEGPFIGLHRKDITIVTDNNSAEDWKKEGWQAIGTYSVDIERTAEIEQQVSKADIIFWTSFRQYEAYKHALRENVENCCSTGRTATLFHRAGISPIVFAGIKGFNAWRSQLNTI